MKLIYDWCWNVLLCVGYEPAQAINLWMQCSTRSDLQVLMGLDHHNMIECVLLNQYKVKTSFGKITASSPKGNLTR